MDKRGEINTGLIEQYAAKLKKDGVGGVFICGTTGEGMLMTSEERKAVTEKWIEQQNDNFKVIVHVGTTSAKQSKGLAMHAQKTGAYAVGCMGPHVFKTFKGRRSGCILLGSCSRRSGTAVLLLPYSLGIGYKFIGCLNF